MSTLGKMPFDSKRMYTWIELDWVDLVYGRLPDVERWRRRRRYRRLAALRNLRTNWHAAASERACLPESQCWFGRRPVRLISFRFPANRFLLCSCALFSTTVISTITLNGICRYRCWNRYWKFNSFVEVLVNEKVDWRKRANTVIDWWVTAALVRGLDCRVFVTLSAS